MNSTHGIVALLVLASSGALAGTTACPAPPVATSDGAICLAELHMATGPSRTHALKYQAEEHEDYWLVAYGPKESNVRGGGSRLKIQKSTGQVVLVEAYR